MMSYKWMIRAAIVLPVLLFGSETGAVAQVADTVDPMTGNYVPGRDPFGNQPKPRATSPSRVNRRLSNRVSQSQSDSDPATEAQARLPTRGQVRAEDDSSLSSLRYPDWWPK